MPAVPVHPPGQTPTAAAVAAADPLPRLLRTPAGLALLEIQGTVHAPPSDAVVGRLIFPDLPQGADEEAGGGTAWMKRVWLYVGANQRLVGEAKALAKPVAVMRRRASPDETAGEELEIVDIVKYKLLFTGRPEPVGERTA